MDRRIFRMYRTDTTVILVFMALTWVTLVYVLREVLKLSDDQGVRAVMIFSAAAAGAFSTAALVAVLVHLRRNRDALYGEDLSHLPGGLRSDGHE